MKAVFAQGYGSPKHVLSIRETPTPQPGKGQVLVRVVATAVTAGDARIRAGRFPRGFKLPGRLALGVKRPRKPILGLVVSGVITQLGSEATGFGVGDEVSGMVGAGMGAHAEYVIAPVSKLAKKPAAVSHAAAAGALFGGSTALHFLREKAGVRAGQRVLINGASGSVGSAALQLAHRAGAHVTAVSSATNHELLRSLGADELIDYTRTDVTALEAHYDIVFDAVGNISRTEGSRMLTEGGALILVVADLVDTLRAGGRVFAGSAPERADAFGELLDLVAEGDLDPLARELRGLEAIVEAHEIVDSGRKVGNLVVLP